MKKSACLVLLALVFFSCNKLQDYLPKPDKTLPEFEKLFGGTDHDAFHSIAVSGEGGYILGGLTYSHDGDVNINYGLYDAWIVKLDKEGTKEWQKVLGGAGGDAANKVIGCADGGYIVAGYTYSNDGHVSGNHGGADAWIIKLDKTGAILWQKQLGGSGDDHAWDIVASSDGGYIVAASTYSNNGDVRGNHGFEDAWIIKLDRSGTIVWQKIFGGSGNDQATSIVANPDGTYVITGLINKGAEPDGTFGNNDVLVVKLDNEGNVLWQKAHGGSGSEIAQSMSKSSDGDYVIAGWVESADFQRLDAFVMKVDKTGNLKWQKTVGGSADDYGNAITATKDGGCLMAGQTSSNDGDVSGNHNSKDAWLVKFDQDGNIQWQKTRGGSYGDYATSILTRSDGSYVMAGYSGSNDGDVSGNHGNADAWVVTIKDK